MEKKKFRISGKLIFNLAVVAISIYLIIYFFVSEDGLIDLLKKPDGCNMLIILAALLIYDLNILVDAVVTLIYVRSKYKDFSFIEALKVAFVGVFFSAITPSSTGGQPMQLYLMSKKNISVGFGSACMTQKFIVYQIVMTAVSVIAVITRFNYFSDAFTNIWSTLFIIFGFTVQLAMTALFLLVSFSRKVTNKLINLIYKIMKKFKFIKNPEKKVERLHKEVDMFHDTNKQLFSSVKRLVVIYALVFIQSPTSSMFHLVWLRLQERQVSRHFHSMIQSVFSHSCCSRQTLSRSPVHRAVRSLHSQCTSVRSSKSVQ